MLRLLCVLLGIYAAYVVEGVGWEPHAGVIGPEWLILAASIAIWTLLPSTGILCAGACGLLQFSLLDDPLWLGPALFAFVGWIMVVLRRRLRLKSLIGLFFLVMLFTMGVRLGLQWHRQFTGETPHVDWQHQMLIVAAQGAATAMWCLGLALLVQALAWSVSLLIPVSWQWRRQRLSP